MIPVINHHYGHDKDGRKDGDHQTEHGNPTMCLAQGDEDGSGNAQAAEIQERLNLAASDLGLG